MEMIEIAGLYMPVYKQKGNQFIKPSSLVETDTVVKNLQKIIYPLNEGHPVLLIGDAGVGKNEMVYYINAKRKIPTYRYSFNEDTFPEELIGSYRISHTDESFSWTNGPLTNAIQESASFVADEMNLTSPHVLKRFSSVYENRCLDVLEGDGSRIQAGDTFSFIATANPREGFEGRKSLPREITKYFTIVYLDNYSQDELFYILKKLYPGISPNIIKATIAVSVKTEELLIKGELGKGDLEKFHFNLRTLKKVLHRVENKYFHDFNDLFNTYFAEPLRKICDRKVVAELISAEVGKIAESKAGYKNNLENKKSIIFANKILNEFTEKILAVIAMKENLLLEYDEEQPVQWYLDRLFAVVNGDIEIIQLSRGMNTFDIIGSLRPSSGKIQWVDGSLTRAIKQGKIIVLKGIESAGAEITEKLNMLTDDTRAIQLTPESGMKEPLFLKENSTIIALKSFRKNRNEPTISRAFRNRFTSVLFPSLETSEILEDVLHYSINNKDISFRMAEFHMKLKEYADKKFIGADNLQGYRFGMHNLLRWQEHILNNPSSGEMSSVERGVNLYYINEISSPNDRAKVMAIFQGIFPEAYLFNLNFIKKKTYSETSAINKNKWWQNAPPREPFSKAALSNSGKKLKKGIEVDTPETGGNTKEGKDAWYGKETRGNKGSGEPGTGGGALGYRTEELFKNFLQKRKNILQYSIDTEYDELQKYFATMEDDILLNLEMLYDPELELQKEFSYRGSAIHSSKYLNFINGSGDEKVFLIKTNKRTGKGFKNLEIFFLLNQSRRIFNFDYSIPMIISLIVSAQVLNEHQIKFKIFAYHEPIDAEKLAENDFSNIKLYDIASSEDAAKIDLKIFTKMISGWGGDSVDEYRILDIIQKLPNREGKTRIIVWISDFRNRRGKIDIETEISSNENLELKKKISNLDKKIVVLAVGLGSRDIASALFTNSLQINEENFSNMPNLIGTELSKLIMNNYSID